MKSNLTDMNLGLVINSINLDTFFIISLFMNFTITCLSSYITST